MVVTIKATWWGKTGGENAVCSDSGEASVIKLFHLEVVDVAKCQRFLTGVAGRKE